MRMTQTYDGEDRPLLLVEEDPEKFKYFDSGCQTAVTRGTVHHIGQWPSHLLTAFVVGCLMVVAFVVFGLIAIILVLPSNERCRIPRDISFDHKPNVYFIKHVNRTWSPTELCYIETTARNYPDVKVYLINLAADNQTRTGSSDPTVQLDDDSSNDIMQHLKKFPLDTLVSDEERSRKTLATFNTNIRNIDVPVDQFFKGSRLAGVSKNLSREMVEMAARSYVLWNFPGVALNPSTYQSLRYLEKYLCKGSQENGCIRDNVAVMQLNGDIQASAVPCQAFVDFLIREIAINELPDQQTTLKQAIREFCPRSSRCTGIRIIDPVSDAENNPEKLSCPTIFPQRIQNITE